MGLRDRVRSLRRRVSAAGVLVHRRDGSSAAFSRAEVQKHLFLAKIARAGGKPEPPGGVAEALRDAPDSERERLEDLLGAGGLFFEGVEENDPREIEELPDLSECAG